MDPNNDELNEDPSEGAPQDPEATEDSFELDKIVIPKAPEKRDQSKASEKPLQIEPETEPTIKPLPKKKAIFFIGVPVILVLAMISFFMLKLIMPSFSKIERGNSKPGAYQKIEPIITNMGKNSYVEISLMIRFNPKKREQFSILKSEITDTILTFMSSPDFQKHVADSEPEKNETHVYNELTKLSKNNYQNQVVLTEIHVD